MIEKPNFASVIVNRGFLNLWINQLLVQLSFNSLNFALIIWVFKLTDSNTAVSALLLSIYLPSVLLGLFAGVLVDIIDRRKIIMVINFFLALSFFSLIFLKMQLGAIYAITFFINALGQFYSLAEVSAIPIIVKREQLLTANSIFSATLYSAFLIGFGLAGPLINHLGIDFLFGLEGTVLVIAFLLSLLFPSIKSIPGEQGRMLIKALSEKKYTRIWEIGIVEILKTIKLIKGKLPVLSSIVILAGVQMGIGVIAVLVPGFLEKSLQIKATDATYVLVIPLGLGIVTGGGILGRFGRRLVKRKLVACGILFSGILSFLVGAAPFISPAISYFRHPMPRAFFYQPSLTTILMAGAFLLGIALVSILVPSQTVLQENTPEKDRGKVFSVLGVAMYGLSLVPILLAGIMADIFGTAPIFLGFGVVIILAGLFGLKPSLFFKKADLSFRVREFLGLGYWESNEDVPKKT